MPMQEPVRFSLLPVLAPLLLALALAPLVLLPASLQPSVRLAF